LTSTQTGWMIRTYNLGLHNKEETVNMFGNFGEWGNRQFDTLVVFQGIYGFPDYLKWFIHKDQTSWKFDNFEYLEVRLFLEMNPSACFFYEKYKITSVKDVGSRVLVLCISTDSIKLQHKISDYDPPSVELREEEIQEVKEKPSKFPKINETLINQKERPVMKKRAKKTGELKPGEAEFRIVYYDTISQIIFNLKEVFNSTEDNADFFDNFSTYARSFLLAGMQDLQSADRIKPGKRYETFLKVWDVPNDLNSVTDIINFILDKFKIGINSISSEFFKRFFETIIGEKIFTVCYHTHPREKDLIVKTSAQFGYEKGWRVMDFINYYAERYGYEWTVKDGILHIGKELMAIEEYGTSDPTDAGEREQEFDKGMKIFSKTRPCLVLSNAKKIWRCLWVKHKVGSRTGGTTSAYFERIGGGTISYDRFNERLDNPDQMIFQQYIRWRGGLSGTMTIVSTPETDTHGQPRIAESPKGNVDPSIRQQKANESNSKKRAKLLTPWAEHKGGIFFPIPGRTYIDEEIDESEELQIERIPYEPMTTYKDGDPNKPHIIGYYDVQDQTAAIKEDKRARPPLKGIRDFLLTLPRNENVENGPKYGPTLYLDGYYGKVLLQCQGIKPRIKEDYIENLPSFEIGKEKKKVTNFFPYPGNIGVEQAILDDADAEEVQYKFEVIDEVVPSEMLNPHGQNETYIYMRPKITESKGQYNQVSLNAAKVKLHLRDDGSQEGGLRIWRFRDDERKEASQVKVLKTKIELQMGNKLASKEPRLRVGKDENEGEGIKLLVGDIVLEVNGGFVDVRKRTAGDNTK